MSDNLDLSLTITCSLLRIIHCSITQELIITQNVTPDCDKDRSGKTHLSLENSQRGSSGRSYSGMIWSWSELRRVVIRTSGVLELMEELESADTCREKWKWLITCAFGEYETHRTPFQMSTCVPDLPNKSKQIMIIIILILIC